MKWILLSIVVAFMAPTTALALACELLTDDVLKADLVARVKIVSVTDAPTESGYTKLVRAIITDMAKGPKNGDKIEILSEQQVIACPYIVYSVGDDCIVIARKLPGGHFETMNSTAGRFEIKGGKVGIYQFYRLETLRHGTDEDFLTDRRIGDFRGRTPAEVMAGFRQLLSKFAR